MIAMQIKGMGFVRVIVALVDLCIPVNALLNLQVLTAVNVLTFNAV
jgi:hypothetical protein